MELTPDMLQVLLASGRAFSFTPEGGLVVGGSPKLINKRAARNERYYNRAKAQNFPAKEWERRRLQVLERDGHKCTYCGSDGRGKALHCDHIIPLAKGGSSEISNLATACKRCNSSKKDKLLNEWRASK